MVDLSQLAISAALKGNWQQALKLNLKILEDEGEHPDVLNRIARAYAECGEISKAKKTAEKVLKIDPFNTIAQKSVERLKLLKNGFKPLPVNLSARHFLEEPGKTKIVPLVKLADPKVLLTLDCGCEVKIKPQLYSTSITTATGKYIGRLPDDISSRINRLMKKGNKYSACVKSSSTHDIKIFLRETKRAKELAHIPSFPAEKINYVAYMDPQLIHNKKSIASPK